MASKAAALLKPYWDKRDFDKTAEPSGKRGAKDAAAGALSFCVQKHDATRLHYDFRIEWEGVLKSWAVTKGPSLDTRDKRLAVRTEDHPLEYGAFEGTIPRGEYGGGTVMLWDRGTWEPQADVEEGLRTGNLKMILHGEKLHGRWALIRMKPRGKETRENWLLIKEKDEFADAGKNLVELMPDSVKTGRDLAAIAAGKDAVWRSSRESGAGEAGEQTPDGGSSDPSPPTVKGRAKPAKPAAAAKAKADAGSAKRSAKNAGFTAPPPFRPVQLATLVAEAPTGNDWLHEMKYDGYRVLIAVGGGNVRLYTRNENDWSERFGFLRPAALALECDSALIDGEVVAFDASGKTDFSTLQKRLKEGQELSCFCFDLLSLDGEDLTALPLTERKIRLEKLLASGGKPEQLIFSQHVVGNGPAVFKNICAAGHEGIVSKQAAAPYRGTRTKSWLKVKCTRRQEFVIGGFSKSDKKGRPFRSILLGAFDDGVLHYRGRVGSGFDDACLADLEKRFAGLIRKSPAFAGSLPLEARRATYLEPALVAEIEFAELTAEGHIRHGVFKGLREDKEALAVVDEAAQTLEPPKQTPKPRQRKAPASGKAASGAAEAVAGIRLTSPDRVVYESQGLTKLDLARYYEAVAPRMLAFGGSRPLSLVRCPQGRQKHCFFQKHDSGGFPDAIRKIPVPEKAGGTEDYLFVDSAAGIVAAVQMGTMEFHIWGARNDRLENPDRLVFDLDPDEGLDFSDVKAAALDMRDRLAGMGLQTFPLITGGKGVHLVAPLSRRQTWEAVKPFAKAFAVTMATAEPQRFVATMSKAKRKGRIFIDWLRNERGATAIAPYSTRSRAGAPVATPVSWDEFAQLDRANGFDPAAILQRLKQPDPWAGYFDVRQSLTKAIRRSVGLD